MCLFIDTDAKPIISFEDEEFYIETFVEINPIALRTSKTLQF